MIERDLGPANELPEAKLSDLNMLVGPGGREHVIDEHVIEGTPAETERVVASVKWS